MTTYTEAELTLYARYTELLRVVCEREHGGFNGIMALALPCFRCARTTPVGSIPKQLTGSDHAVCPACVKARGLVGALERALYGEAARAVQKGNAKELASMTDEVARAMRPKAVLPMRKTDAQPKARAARIRAGLPLLEERLKNATTDEEREACAKLIAVAQKAIALDEERAKGGG